MSLEFLQPVLIGISIAAPIGPTALLCIKRTLVKGKLSGIISGLGAVSADLIYSTTIFFGLSELKDSLDVISPIIGIAGSIILILWGLSLIFKPHKKGSLSKNSEIGENSLIKDFFSTFIITITTPLTLIIFSSMLNNFQNEDFNDLRKFTTVLGISLGESLWWIFLVSLTSLLKNRFKERYVVYINKVVGIGLIIFGILLILRTLT